MKTIIGKDRETTVFDLYIFFFFRLKMNTYLPRVLSLKVGTSAGLHTSATVHHIQKLTRLRVVDNSELGKSAMLEGRPPRCIHVYNKKGFGHTGK